MAYISAGAITIRDHRTSDGGGSAMAVAPLPQVSNVQTTVATTTSGRSPWFYASIAAVAIGGLMIYTRRKRGVRSAQ